MGISADKDFISFFVSVHSAPKSGDGAVQPCEDERVACCKINGSLLIAVLDGCGGTGGRHYPQAESWTGARLASHLAGRVLYRWFVDQDDFSTDDQADNLQAALSEALICYNSELQKNSNSPLMIRSSMNKDLPTTLAAMTAVLLPGGKFSIRSFWAGNSRNYVFSPSGLKQLSMDDIVGGYDPYEDLIKDGILNNTVNASAPFTIHSVQVQCESPCMVFSASDGIFGYLDSPVRLEWILLDTLHKAKSPLQWEALLREAFALVSGDDHTLQLAALGFADFAELKKIYDKRWKMLGRNWIRPLERAEKEIDTDSAEKLWLSYKKDYLILDRKPEKNDGQ